jgi:hypothetical protein
MFGWLKNKKKEAFPDIWSICESQENGLPLIIKLREQPPAGIDCSLYQHLVSILWKYDGTENNGMPDSDLSFEMGEIEDKFEPIEHGSIAYMVAAITGNGRKEWLWYTKDAQAYMQIVNQLLKDIPNYPLDFEVSPDPEWKTYQAFIRALPKQ